MSNKNYSSDKATTRLDIIGIILYRTGRFITKLSYKLNKRKNSKINFYKDMHGVCHIIANVNGERISSSLSRFIDSGYCYYLSEFEKDELLFNVKDQVNTKENYYAIFSDDGISILDQQHNLIHENMTSINILIDRKIVNSLCDADYNKILNISRSRNARTTTEI